MKRAIGGRTQIRKKPVLWVHIHPIMSGWLSYQTYLASSLAELYPQVSTMIAVTMQKMITASSTTPAIIKVSFCFLSIKLTSTHAHSK